MGRRQTLNIYRTGVFQKHPGICRGRLTKSGQASDFKINMSLKNVERGSHFTNGSISSQLTRRFGSQRKRGKKNPRFLFQGTSRNLNCLGLARKNQAGFVWKTKDSCQEETRKLQMRKSLKKILLDTKRSCRVAKGRLAFQCVQDYLSGGRAQG